MGEVDMVYYHGTTTAAGLGHVLLPPQTSRVISQRGRKKNLDRVFMTTDLGLARIYAGRAAYSLGGEPVVKRAIPMGDVECIDDRPGAGVYHCAWAFCEELCS